MKPLSYSEAEPNTPGFAAQNASHSCLSMPVTGDAYIFLVDGAINAEDLKAGPLTAKDGTTITVALAGSGATGGGATGPSADVTLNGGNFISGAQVEIFFKAGQSRFLTPTTLTASSTMLSAIATDRSDSSAVYTASGMVCVTPGKLPANVMVAPNSPSARAHESTAPATRAGRAACDRAPRRRNTSWCRSTRI